MDKVYLGRELKNFYPGVKSRGITRVELLDENGDIVAVSGSDTGKTLTALQPDGTDEMAAYILSRVSGYAHLGYEGDDALLDPAAELGDAITVDGHYVPFVAQDIIADTLWSCEISAPDADEIDDEFPYKSTMQRQIERSYAKSRSLIKKTSEEILLKVEGKADAEDVTAQIKTALDGIELSVSSSGGSSTFKLMSDGAELSTQTLNLSVNAVNVTGKLTASQIDATNLKVGAANITGSLTIGQLPSSVATDDDIPTKTSDLTNDSGYQTRSGVVSIIDGTVDADYVNALEISATELYGEIVYLRETRSGNDVGYLALSDTNSGIGVELYSNAGLKLGCSRGSNMFITNNGRSGSTQGFLQINNLGDVTISGQELILGAALYGDSLPSGVDNGQIFFLFQ